MMAPISAEEQNFVRLMLLLNGVTPRAVRTLFDKIFPHTNLNATLQANRRILESRKNLNQAQLDLLFPKPNVVPNSMTFDVTLMVYLIRNFSNINRPTNGFDSLPLPTDTSPESDLARIKWYRNKLSHHDSDKIDSVFFTEAWDDLSYAVGRLGGQQMKEECQELKSKILDLPHQELMREIGQSQLAIDNLESRQEEITETIGKLRDSHDTLKQRTNDNFAGLQNLPPNHNDSAKRIFESADPNVPSTSQPLPSRWDVEKNSKSKKDVEKTKKAKKDVEKSKSEKDLKKDSKSNKTVMSKTSPEVTPDTHLQEPAAPVVEDRKIPEQIKKMDHESIAIYLNALESGSERRRDINLIIVGKKSVGKTSLVRRLFGEELQSVKSTNGIEIHRRRCRINLSNWEWNKVLDTRLVKETSINNRILQSIVKELHQDKEKPKHDILEISSLDQISTDDNKGTITKKIEHDKEPQPKMNYQFAYPEITEPPISKLAKDELLSIIGSAVDLQDEDDYANLTVWDFAGDIEYYNTHQTFLNSEAIFLVVANLHDIDDTVSYGTFNFWMDTIHCYGSINDKTEAVLLEGAHNLLDPPVIAIGTHKDKFQDEEQCRKRLESYIDKIFKDSKLHLRSVHLISNTEDVDVTFEKLRNDIFATAKSTANWNREYPVKFIQMEKAINSELTIGKQIISFERLKELGEKIPLPITDNKELHLFLRYQHEIGNVIFFEDISSYIILDPQWLANAFTCIVTAQQFQFELPHLQWDNFKKTGKMDPKLLEEIFKKQSADMRIHKEHILEVIEKFDIIIYPLLLTESGNVQREHSFYVPCMLQTLKIKDIDVLFNVPNASKSTCLCFVFSFLPPYLISNLIVSCLREYPLAVVKGEIGLFKDCCVFNIDSTGCAKFVLAKSSHMIQLQVWQWDEVDTEVNQAVLKVVEREINRIVNTRYKLKTVSFEKKWKCETTSFSFDTGFREFDQVNDGKNYYCEEHATVHKYKDYWSGEKSKAPGRLSSEEQNYVRMSKIVLEVLSGVLYDRLFLDTKTGEILDRKKLDITEMCKKYCALKINSPSKGFRKIEEVDQISTNEDAIGDDIQRIRVIRNEMQHSSVFALDDTRYQTLITIVHDMLTRFDQRNNPAGESYVKRLDEIRKMELETRSFDETKERMKAGLIEKMHAVFDSMVSDAVNDIC